MMIVKTKAMVDGDGVNEGTTDVKSDDEDGGNGEGSGNGRNNDRQMEVGDEALNHDQWGPLTNTTKAIGSSNQP